MLACCQFRDDPAILLMKFDLRSHKIRQDTSMIDNGDAGLVAGSLECQKRHELRLRYPRGVAILRSGCMLCRAGTEPALEPDRIGQRLNAEFGRAQNKNRNIN